MLCVPGRRARRCEIRRPDAVRPWQHVLEPLSGYLMLAQRLWEQPALAGAYNFGPELGEAVKVRDLVELACAAYGDGKVDYGDGSEGPHESGWLVLDAGKTESVLGFSQRWTLIEGVKRTMALVSRLCWRCRCTRTLSARLFGFHIVHSRG